MSSSALLLACGPDAIIAAVPRDAGPDVVTSDAPHACPRGRGSAMADLGDYCIDLTEVTKAQYAEFLATSPSFLAQAPECAWNVRFAPNSIAIGSESSCDESITPGLNDAIAHPARPVVCVDWCDAAAYCVWAGKRLCGARGGASDGYVDEPSNTLNDATQSEWYGACVGPGATAYPYGNVYDASTCFVDDAPTARDPADVASRPGCHGPAGSPNAAVYDLSGNVLEWTNACRPYAGDGRGETNMCVARGGWWRDTRFGGGAQTCAITSDNRITWPRARADNHIGFRCCG